MSKQLGRISGPLLSANLFREGTDLRFENQLLYLDVTNKTLSINSTPINKELFVDGTLRTDAVIVDAPKMSAGNLEIGPNDLIKATTGTVILSGSNYVQTHTVKTDDLEVTGQSISAYTTDTDIEIRPTGILDIYANTNITGDLHATGNITADGSVIFGSDDADSVTFDSDVKSDLIPDITSTYSLGESGKRWNDFRFKKYTGNILYTNNIIISDITLTVSPRNAWFVSALGSDSNQGINESGAFATIAKALDMANPGDTVHIFPGTYTEVFPLTVPQGVTIKGQGTRSVTVQPTSGTNTNNAFLLNGETAVADLTVANFYQGYAFSFALGAKTTTRSPYVQNCSVITSGVNAGKGALVDGSVVDATSNEASMLFHSCTFITPGVDALTMTNGVRVEWLNSFTYFANRSLYATNGVLGLGSQARHQLTVQGVTAQTIQSGDTITVPLTPSGTRTLTITNVEYSGSTALITVIGDPTNIQTYTTTPPGVSTTYYTDKQIFGDPSYYARITRLGGRYTDGTHFNDAIFNNLIVVGSRVIVKWNNQPAEIDMGIVTQVDRGPYSFVNHYVYVTNPSNFSMPLLNGSPLVDFQASYFRIENTTVTLSGGQTGLYISNVETLPARFGAEIRAISSASVYGNYGAVADGADTLMYLIQYNFGYVGSGLDSSNDRTLVVQANEVVELNNGKIYFQSVDQQGNFRVGKEFFVDFDNGTTSIDITSGAVNGISSLTIGFDPNQTFIDYSKIDIGDFTLRNNDILTKSKTFNIVSASGEVNLTENVAVAKDLSVVGDVNIGGTITVGNQTSDSISITADIDSDIIPDTSKDYNIGSTDKRWATLNVTESYVNQVKLSTNQVSILNTDANLVLNATGKVSVPSNDVEFDQTLRVNGATNLTDVGVTGDITHTGAYNQTGLRDITGNASATTSGKFSNITFVNDTIRSDTSLNFALLSGNGKLNIVSNNADISIKNNRIINNKNDPIVFSTNGGYVKFAGTGAMAIPVGLETERPATAETGTLRVNSTSGNAEVYTQPTNTWNDITGLGDIATREVVEEYGNLWILILG